MFKKKEHHAPPVEPVHLKRRWNLEPPVYLSIIWAAILIATFYVIAILPGQIKPGRYFQFSSPVEGSALYLDDEYLGSGVITEFVPSGTYTLHWEFRDAGSVEEEFTVKPSVLFTHLFPKKYPVSSSFYLSGDSLERYYDALFEDVVTHSAILSYDKVYHYPPLFMYAAGTAVAGGDTTRILSFLRDSALFITTEEMAADFNQAIALLKEHGADTSSLEKATDLIAKISFDNTETSTSAVPSPVQSNAPSSALERTALAVDGYTLYGYTYPASEVNLGSAGKELIYPGIHEAETVRSVPSFTIAESEVSEYLYALFIEANPSWAKTNRDALVAQGLADTSYLDGTYPTTAFVSTSPVRNISWYAAQAFTAWLSQKTGKSVSLMSEAQYEAAAASETRYSTSLSTVVTGNRPVALLGGVWEMTSDTFIPLERYLGYTPQRDMENALVIIKGGSYLNSADTVTRSTIGLMGKEDCSDTAGFRIVWN